MQFPYFKVPHLVGGKIVGVTYRPLIPVSLKSGGKTVDYLTLIDSGADYNIFPGFLAKELNLEFSDEFLNVSGLGGATFKAYGAEVEMEIGGVAFRTKVYFSTELPKEGHAVLGQVGFFDKFRVKFEYDRKIVELTPIS